jgi:cell division protein FtsB
VSRGATARWVIVLLALLFAIQGGEYSTWNWWQLHRAEQQETALVAELTEVVDSLQKAAVAIERDPRVQERAARESFGMIRDGEFLYRIEAPAEP